MRFRHEVEKITDQDERQVVFCILVKLQKGMQFGKDLKPE